MSDIAHIDKSGGLPRSLSISFPRSDLEDASILSAPATAHSLPRRGVAQLPPPFFAFFKSCVCGKNTVIWRQE